MSAAHATKPVLPARQRPLMLDARDKALKSLAVYLRRGYEAQEAWTVRGADAFFAVMNEREAAFQNFRYFEDQAQRAGLTVATDPEARRLEALVTPLNAALARLLVAALGDVESKLARTNAVRNATRAYHSGTPAPARFLKQT
jgi:hypothetical protein